MSFGFGLEGFSVVSILVTDPSSPAACITLLLAVTGAFCLMVLSNLSNSTLLEVSLPGPAIGESIIFQTESSTLIELK